MSSDSIAPTAINNNGHARSTAGWGIPHGQRATALNCAQALSCEQLNYALRALVRHDVLAEALQFGYAEGRNQVSAALLESGHDVQAVLWAASASYYRQYGHLRDRELFHLTAVGMLSEFGLEQTAPGDLRALVDQFYEGDAPDLTAGREAIADLLEYHLADRVEADAWTDWSAQQGLRPREFLPAIQQTRETIAHFRAGAEPRGPYSTSQFLGVDRDSVRGILHWTTPVSCT